MSREDEDTVKALRSYAFSTLHIYMPSNEANGIIISPSSPLEISSTEIRQKISAGEDVSDVLTKEAYEFIRKEVCMDTQRNKEFFYEIKKHLTPSRFYHSLNVAYEAYRLAGIYKADREKAFTAGLLHDIMKDTPKQEQLKIITDDGIILTHTEKSSTKTWHQLSGAVYIKKYLGVKDEDIISAVRYHTTGRENMTLLEKVVYIADYISADRRYPGVERMREKAYRSLDEAMLEGLQFTVIENVKKGFPIHEDSVKAYNFIAISYERKKL